MLNSDYKDILLALSNKKAKFILVGAYAMAAHGFPRSTMDLGELTAIIMIEEIPVQVLSVADLIKNKRVTGRTKDLADAEALEILQTMDKNGQN